MRFGPPPPSPFPGLSPEAVESNERLAQMMIKVAENYSKEDKGEKNDIQNEDRNIIIRRSNRASVPQNCGDSAAVLRDAYASILGNNTNI